MTTMSMVMDVLVILFVVVLAAALREGVLYYRWIQHLRRARSGSVTHEEFRRIL
jgi:hypothetical protein